MTTDTVPSHVPPHLVRDVDVHHLVGGHEDPYQAWAEIHKTSPDIFFTPRYGGYWVLNRAEYFSQVFSNHEVFSSTVSPIIPAAPPQVPILIPLQKDPPEHRFFRHPFSMAVSPRHARDLGDIARQVTIERIEEFINKGECEFSHEVAMHVPVAVIMHLIGLPFEDRARLFPLVNTVTHSDDLVARGMAVQGILDYSYEKVAERAKNPGNDFVTKLLATEVDGRPITQAEVGSQMTVVILGGLDSVTHTVSGIMRFLAQSPAHQKQLADNPEIMPNALEELLRRHSVTSTTRIATRDIEVGGVQMKAGDRVILELCLHGLDEQKWENPLEVDFNRKPVGIMNFGTGIHKCVGGQLARAEIRALLEEWLKRIPSFTIKPGEKVRTTTGQSQAINYLPLIWPAVKH